MVFSLAGGEVDNIELPYRAEYRISNIQVLNLLYQMQWAKIIVFRLIKLVYRAEHTIGLVSINLVYQLMK